MNLPQTIDMIFTAMVNDDRRARRGRYGPTLAKERAALVAILTATCRQDHTGSYPWVSYSTGKPRRSANAWERVDFSHRRQLKKVQDYLLSLGLLEVAPGEVRKGVAARATHVRATDKLLNFAT